MRDRARVRATVLAHCILPASQLPSPAKAAAILPVFVGAALSATGAHAPSAFMVALTLVCNGCTALCGIQGKRIGAKFKTDPSSEWFHICVAGTALHAAYILASGLVLATPLPTLPPRALTTTALTSGAAFFARMQLSWLCLGKGYQACRHVSHSLCNSLRRPATILAALFYALVAFSPLNSCGDALACGGAVLYSLL